MARRHQLLSRSAAVAAAVALIFTTACAGEEAGDDAADTAAVATTPAPADTGMMAGMDHMSGMNRSAPHDTNQVFLRMMSDHHQGLIALTDTALPKLQGAAKSDAEKVRDKQKQEQERMMAMLHSTHGDSITPMMMPSNMQMMQAMATASGAAADSAWYQHTIHHHEEGIRMTERLMPHLTGEVKQMAEKMVADQRKEIEEFQRKMRG